MSHTAGYVIRIYFNFISVQVARKRNGFLSIKFISSFKRMRELSRDWQTTARALTKSEKLELSEDGMKVSSNQTGSHVIRLM